MQIKNSSNILGYFHDNSIFNILSHELQKKRYRLHKYTVSFSFDLHPPHLIIIDGSLHLKDITHFLGECKKHSTDANILLAVSENFDYFLSKKLPNMISGIIYKPFIIDELKYVIDNVHQYSST